MKRSKKLYKTTALLSLVLLRWFGDNSFMVLKVSWKNIFLRIQEVKNLYIWWDGKAFGDLWWLWCFWFLLNSTHAPLMKASVSMDMLMIFSLHWSNSMPNQCCIYTHSHSWPSVPCSMAVVLASPNILQRQTVQSSSKVEYSWYGSSSFSNLVLATRSSLSRNFLVLLWSYLVSCSSTKFLYLMDSVSNIRVVNSQNKSLPSNNTILRKKNSASRNKWKSSKTITFYQNCSLRTKIANLLPLNLQRMTTARNVDLLRAVVKE